MAEKKVPRYIGAVEDYYIFDRKKDLLGHGSFGQVFKVKRVADGKVFAMKESFSSDRNVFHNALEEFDLMSLLSSAVSKNSPKCYAGIVCYEDIFIARSPSNKGDTSLREPPLAVYIVMQYIKGCDMKRLIKVYGMGLDDETLHKFMQNIMRTVAFIHSKNIVQGALELKHILFTEEMFYLVDFKYAHFDLDIDDALADDIKTIGEGFMELYLGPGKHLVSDLPDTFLGNLIKQMIEKDPEQRPTSADVVEVLALD